MAIFGYDNIRFDPVGFFQELGSRLGAMPSEGLRPPQIRIPPSSPDNVTATVQPPQSPDFPTLSVQQPLGNGLTGLDPSIQPEDFAHPALQKKQKELNQTAADQADEAKQNAIVPPALLEQAKAAKIKDPDMGMMLELIPKGINPLTDPKKFLEYFGATASQNNMARTWGPLQSLREAMSPEYQALQARQDGLLQVGTFLTKKILEQSAERLGAPTTLGEANAVAPGMVQPTAQQAQQRIEAPASDSAFVGPGQGVQDPNARLMPWQQDLVLGAMKGLAGGHLLRTPEGAIEPTQIAAMQGRRLTPEQVSAVNDMIMSPLDTFKAPTVPLPASAVNKGFEERGQRVRAAEKGPEYEKRVESLAAVESVKRFGKVLSFSQLVQADPELGARVREQADVTDPMRIYNAQQDAQAVRMLRTAGPLETARKEADRDQPVQEPQLWRDPYTGEAAKPTMTTRQAQDQSFVKLRPDQVETINQLSTIDDGLRKVEELIPKVMSAKQKGPLAEIARAAGQTVYLNYLRAIGDEDIVKMDSTIARLTAPLVKSQGDTANIAVAERDMIARALVNNQASSEAAIANIKDVRDSVKRARSMMGFKSREDLVRALQASGMKEYQIFEVLKKKGL